MLIDLGVVLGEPQVGATGVDVSCESTRGLIEFGEKHGLQNSVKGGWSGHCSANLRDGGSEGALTVAKKEGDFVHQT